MYEVLFKLKVRTSNPDNKSGKSWNKIPSVTLTGETIEDIMEQASKLRPPDDIDAEAIMAEGSLSLTKVRHVSFRKDIDLRMFREI